MAAVSEDNLHFGTLPDDPNGVADCHTCNGRGVKDGAVCPSCLARQEVRTAWWKSSRGPEQLRRKVTDYLAAADDRSAPTAGWISGEQLDRDHRGLRDTCSVCGHEGTANHPLIVDSGSRRHKPVHDEQLGRDTCSIFVRKPARQDNRQETAALTNERNTTMAVEEIRAGIAVATEKCNASVAALQQATQALEEAQQILGQVTSGSTQPEVAQAHGLLAEVVQQIMGQQSTIQAAVSSAESYSARL